MSGADLTMLPGDYEEWRVQGAPAGQEGSAEFTIRDGSTIFFGPITDNIEEEVPGDYVVRITAPDIPAGTYGAYFDAGGTPAQITIEILANPLDPVLDLRDTRVLIPRTRRALEGPHASASGAATSYTDGEVNAMVADAIADILLYSGADGEVFGHQLEVTARDNYYSAPTAWRTSEQLSEPEVSLIVAQAALTHFTTTLKTLKTSERIADEGQEWEYQIAASVLTEQIKALRADRDRAIEILKGENVITEEYVNFLEVRDAATASLIEPYSTQAGVGGQQRDPRGFL